MRPPIYQFDTFMIYQTDIYVNTFIGNINEKAFLHPSGSDNGINSTFLLEINKIEWYT